MKRMIMQIQTFSIPLRAECFCVDEADYVHQALVCFGKLAPCHVAVFSRDAEQRVATVELKITGTLV